MTQRYTAAVLHLPRSGGGPVEEVTRLLPHIRGVHAYRTRDRGNPTVEVCFDGPISAERCSILVALLEQLPHVDRVHPVAHKPDGGTYTVAALKALTGVLEDYEQGIDRTNCSTHEWTERRRAIAGVMNAACNAIHQILTPPSVDP